jgi:hypothetical protein
MKSLIKRIILISLLSFIQADIEAAPATTLRYEFDNERFEDRYTGVAMIGNQNLKFTIDLETTYSWVSFPKCLGCPTEKYFNPDESPTYESLITTEYI